MIFFCVFALFCCSNRLFDGAFPCACMKTRVTFYKDAQQLTTSIRCIDSLDENTNNTRLYIRYRIFWCVVWLPPQTLCMYVTIGSHSNNRTTFAVVCHINIVCIQGVPCKCAEYVCMSEEKEHGCISDPSLCPLQIYVVCCRLSSEKKNERKKEWNKIQKWEKRNCTRIYPCISNEVLWLAAATTLKKRIPRSCVCVCNRTFAMLELFSSSLFESRKNHEENAMDLFTLTLDGYFS